LYGKSLLTFGVKYKKPDNADRIKQEKSKFILQMNVMRRNDDAKKYPPRFGSKNKINRNTSAGLLFPNHVLSILFSSKALSKRASIY